MSYFPPSGMRSAQVLYTGNGAASNIIAIPFRPKFLVIGNLSVPVGNSAVMAFGVGNVISLSPVGSICQVSTFSYFGVGTLDVGAAFSADCAANTTNTVAQNYVLVLYG
jgi:hypothetical protein